MNKKIGLLFAGQGSQYINMGLDFYQNYSFVRELFYEANQILGYSLEEIIFKENNNINQTQYTQPAVLVTSCIIYEVLKREVDIDIAMIAGFSLGEYSALYASGVFNFKEIVSLIKYRSQFMAEEADKNPGKMAAIIGLKKEELDILCQEIPGVYIANYNTSEQLVVGGKADQIQLLMEAALQKKAKRAIMLNVSGGFHTPLMNEASKKMNEILLKYTPKKPLYDLITNWNAKVLLDVNELKDLMSKQISSPVLFEDTINLMISEGVEEFIEIGPGKVLSGFVRRIDSSKKVLSVEKIDDLKNIITMEGI